MLCAQFEQLAAPKDSFCASDIPLGDMFGILVSGMSQQKTLCNVIIHVWSTSCRLFVHLRMLGRSIPRRCDDLIMPAAGASTQKRQKPPRSYVIRSGSDCNRREQKRQQAWSFCARERCGNSCAGFLGVP